MLALVGIAGSPKQLSSRLSAPHHCFCFSDAEERWAFRIF